MANLGAIGWAYNKTCRRFIPYWSTYTLTLAPYIDIPGISQPMFMDPLNGYIAGHVYTDSSKSTPVANQPVYLLCRESGRFVTSTITNASGYYEFDQLVASLHYITFTPGYKSTVNGVIEDNITPGTH